MHADEDLRYVTDWIAAANLALADGDVERAGRLFRPDGYWRDSLSLAWGIETAKGPDEIARLLGDAVNALPSIVIDGPVTRGSLPGLGASVECRIAWQGEQLSGRGYLRLSADASPTIEGAAITLLTAAESLDGVVERSLRNRDLRSWSPPERTWADERAWEQAFADRDPEVLIVGAGHAGLALAARLRHLGVDALVLESKPRIGDTWRSRYRTLRLHNEISANHLPYLPFPASWPMFVPKDKLAGWFELYCEALELNVWTGARLAGGTFDESDDRWTVQVAMAGEGTRTLRPRRLVLATGLSGKARLPRLPGSDTFTGMIMHSEAYVGDVDVEGRSVVILGTGTSAHDIAEDVHVRGGSATMLQRSPTTVVSLAQSARAYEMHRVGEGVRPIEDTDLMASSIPWALLRRLHVPLNASMVAADRELHEGLERRGFRVDRSTSFFVKLLERLGGYYLDVGASGLIADGAIAVRATDGIERLEGDDVILADGSRLRADLLVLSTGYTSFRESVAELLGRDVADRIGEVWGLDESGELRNMWKRTGQPGLYVAGGPLTMCRFYSRSLALRLKAELEGLVVEPVDARGPAPVAVVR